MALVKCPDCQTDVSDRAATCPRCGYESPGGKAVLEVMRVKRMAASRVGCHVWIDSTDRGNLHPGKSVQSTVKPGAHLVECITDIPVDSIATVAREIIVPAGRRVVVIVTVSWPLGKPSLVVEEAPI